MTKKKHKNQAPTVLSTSAVSGNKYLALSFIFPMAILGTVYALNGVYPFGNMQILTHDFYHQDYPFFSGFWHKLRDGTVSLWSWTAGMGHDYASSLTIFLNPLNLLALIAPHAWLREVLTLILLIKIGCAGLFTAMFLRYAYKQNSLPVGKKGAACPLFLPVCSSLYALCAFTLGYYYLIYFFDSFALLPLIILGLLALMREGKFKLYIVSLALSISMSFYFGYIICVFVVITFICQSIAQKLSLPDFLRKLRLITAYSALAAGLSAIFIIPSLSALQNVYINRASSPTMSLYNSFFDILGNFIAFTPPTVIEGLPNLYSGLISIMLIGFFIQSKRIAFREKIVFLGILVFLLLCTNIDILYIFMHGFTRPNGIPARFSFLISFVLVVMAYRTFLLTEGMDRQGSLAICISASLFLLSAVFGPQEKKYIIGSTVLCAFYILLLYFSMTSRNVRVRAFARAALLMTVLAELFITTYIGVKTVGTTNRNEYYAGYEQIKSLLNARKKTNVDFYRTEFDYNRNSNNPYFYYYNGVTFFSSGINPDIMRFFQGLGLNSRRSDYNSNSFYYIETSPLTNAFINMRYMISPDGDSVDKDVYWKIVGKNGNALLLENKYYLPLGFMVNNKLADYKRHDDPFQAQNNFFRLATGLDGDLFDTGQFSISDSYKNDNKNKVIKWDFQFPYTGMLYAYCLFNERESRKESEVFFLEINLNRPGTGPSQLYIGDNTPFIFVVGNITENENITFSLQIDNKDNKATLNFGLLNSELFEQGYAKLASQVLQLTEFTNTKVRGRITSFEDGLLYTSIPVDKNWSAYVDGVKRDIVLIDNAMIAVSLNQGYHEIEFRYFNKSFLAGCIVSLVSLALFIALAVLETRKRRRSEM
jgi:uncharacterized membrane protein YfhO